MFSLFLLLLPSTLCLDFPSGFFTFVSSGNALSYLSLDPATLSVTTLASTALNATGAFDADSAFFDRTHGILYSAVRKGGPMTKNDGTNESLLCANVTTSSTFADAKVEAEAWFPSPSSGSKPGTPVRLIQASRSDGKSMWALQPLGFRPTHDGQQCVGATRLSGGPGAPILNASSCFSHHAHSGAIATVTEGTFVRVYTSSFTPYIGAYIGAKGGSCVAAAWDQSDRDTLYLWTAYGDRSIISSIDTVTLKQTILSNFTAPLYPGGGDVAFDHESGTFLRVFYGEDGHLGRGGGWQVVKAKGQKDGILPFISAPTGVPDGASIFYV